MVVLKAVVQYDNVIIGAVFFSTQLLLFVCLGNASSFQGYKVYQRYTILDEYV